MSDLPRQQFPHLSGLFTRTVNENNKPESAELELQRLARENFLLKQLLYEIKFIVESWSINNHVKKPFDPHTNAYNKLQEVRNLFNTLDLL